MRPDALQVFVGGISQSEHFIGDGSTKIFALSGVVATADSVITINGELQVINVDYTIVNTTLTFTTAPSVEAVIVVAAYTIDAIDPVEITFETPPNSGVEVLILVRRGVTWYAPGAGTPSNGEPLQITNTAAARFLRGL